MRGKLPGFPEFNWSLTMMGGWMDGQTNRWMDKWMEIFPH